MDAVRGIAKALSIILFFFGVLLLGATLSKMADGQISWHGIALEGLLFLGSIAANSLSKK